MICDHTNCAPSGIQQFRDTLHDAVEFLGNQVGQAQLQIMAAPVNLRAFCPRLAARIARFSSAEELIACVLQQFAEPRRV